MGCLPAAWGCGPEIATGSGSGSTGGPGPGTSTVPDGTDGDPDDGSATGGDGTSGTPPDAGDSSGTGGETGDPIPWDGTCEHIEILFVADGSDGARRLRESVFAHTGEFVEQLAAAAPADVSIRIGLTRGQMGFSALGDTSIDGDACFTAGDDGAPAESFYTTPDVLDTGDPGAQGRLLPHQGLPFATLSSGGNRDTVAAWLQRAAPAFDGGSNVPMLAGPLGWLAHPSAADTNDGFLVDRPSVLGVFTFTNMFDPTPPSAAGEIVDRLLAGDPPLSQLLRGSGAGRVSTWSVR